MSKQRKGITTMRKLILLVTGVCLLVMLAPVALAKGKKNAGPATVPSDCYAKYDKNYNGTLDADEKEALRKDFDADKNGPSKAFDKDNDGKLSDEELAAIPATKSVDAPAKKKKKKNQ
jgi:hypothetical protein